MRRILRVFILCLIGIPTICLADGRTVTFDVTFEDVDPNLINNIYVYYTDQSESEYSITLKKENNYLYSYDLYNGSDILRVSVLFDQSNFFGESSIVKIDGGYNIHITVKSQESNEIVIDNTPTTSVTTTNPTPVTTNSTTAALQYPITTTVQSEVTTIKTKEEQQTQIIRNVYIFILIVLGVFGLIFLSHAIIKIVNANK